MLVNTSLSQQKGQSKQLAYPSLENFFLILKARMALDKGWYFS